MDFQKTRGFALVEAAVTAAVGVVLLALLVLLGAESRRLARLGEDMSNLRQIGAWTASYGADNQDVFWSFSWKKGQSLSQWPDLNAQAQQSDLAAAAAQAVDILRRVAGRLDILPISNWIPHILYSQLVLEDYSTSQMPDLTFVSAADTARLGWARDPLGAIADKRWPYSSSFIMPTAFYDSSPAAQRVSQASTQSTFFVPSAAQLGGRALPEVAFPSAKVLLHDQIAWHFGARQPYCTHDEARLPILFVDGSVSVRAASDANPGWQPTQPASPAPTQFNYAPGSGQPPPMSGGATDPVIGRFRWTRGSAAAHGLVGRDFGGPETCSGQPGCP